MSVSRLRGRQLCCSGSLVTTVESRQAKTSSVDRLGQQQFHFPNRESTSVWGTSAIVVSLVSWFWGPHTASRVYLFGAKEIVAFQVEWTVEANLFFFLVLSSE